MRIVTYRTDEGTRTAIVGRPGRKYLPAVLMDAGGLRVHKLPLAEDRYMTDLDYSLRAAARKYLKAGRLFGITKAAKALLKAATTIPGDN